MPTAFGQKLKETRELRGLSIEDASFETRIPVQRLRLLESGNLAAFGSMTYARSFIRRYSDYLEVDASEVLEDLPEGVLGGERDYRYLTQSHGPWLRENITPSVSTVSAPPGRLQSIKSPVPAAIAVFVLILAGTAMWGKHVADAHRQVEPAALKALPVEDNEEEAQPAPTVTSTVDAASVKSKQVDFPVSVRKATPVD
ncbi:helix-turn-helix domain-containing protein [Prosthecobacter sp.]|uniref:helix-turn-helix domain-containing protein n=1 Tax=Prosthecobacter sp. TaxID=1965333 RepID=UPI001DC6E82E|nr:helix-turn-helix domain-containing protein [Prosthecobacter sp.]MCB1276573.1 helix-turn-helix domain-containing protein [Prosthecobacter sp.]